MPGIRGFDFVLVLLLFGAAFGCAKTQSTKGGTVATGSTEEGEPRSSKPTRAEIACHLHSCAPPYYCNREKGVCEQLPCTDSRDCPYGYKCDFSRNVCE